MRKLFPLLGLVVVATAVSGCGSKPEPDPVLSPSAGTAPAAYDAPKDRAGNPAQSKSAPKAPDVYTPTDRNGQPTGR